MGRTHNKAITGSPVRANDTPPKARAKATLSYASKLLAASAMSFAASVANAANGEPIIDVHMHAYLPNQFGPAVKSICAPYEEWPARDPAADIDDYLEGYTKHPHCSRPLTAPSTADELRNRSIAVMDRLNIVLGVASGEADVVERWRQQAPGRFIPGVRFGIGKFPSIDELRQLHAAGRLKVLGEIVAQTGGYAPDDPKLEPYYALAEELDIPVSIHIGFNNAGIAYYGAPNYRASLGDPLKLEDVLLRHPRMRIYVNHAAYPFIDRMIALMHAHPQVYVDTAAIDFVLPRKEFHHYLQQLVDAGFSRRIMFGSDQMIWPEAQAAAVDNIENADFLTPEQKRDILYNNAARFFRLDEVDRSTSTAR